MATTTQADRRVLIGAGLFIAIGLLLQWWRLEALQASYDQGVFLQSIWNGLRGHPFESTLSSQLSTNVLHSGEPPSLGYHRLGQHFTPALLLWVPLVGVLGKWALPLVQVGLIGAAGVVLYRLARLHLEPTLASWVACSWFGANAVLGPTWSNFTDLCQLPLCFFVLLLGLRQRRWLLILPAALLMPLIREDTGVVLMGIALWMLVRRQGPWLLAYGLGLYGGGWVLVSTNLLMPLFSDDNSKRFMIENFGQYLEGDQQASSFEVLLRVLQQPFRLLWELVNPPGKTLMYLLGQTLPLLFVPLLAVDSWLLVALPLTGLLLAQGYNDPLSINLRYTLLVAPGLFAGAVLWWERHQQLFANRRLRSFWIAAVALSLIFTLGANPGRSVSFLHPDSVVPWVSRSPLERWQHSRVVFDQLQRIPADATVAANTPLVPHLAQREVLVRFPNTTLYLNRQRQPQTVEWIAADLNGLANTQIASKEDSRTLQSSLRKIKRLQADYGLVSMQDGLVLMQRGATDDPQALVALQRFEREVLTKRTGKGNRQPRQNDAPEEHS